MVVAIFRDGLTFDQFHHEVGYAIAGGAAIEKTRDIRMVEAGQELALIFEAAQRTV